MSRVKNDNTILSHISNILDFTEKNGISEDFMKNAKTHIDFVSDFYSISPDMAILFSHFIGQGKNEWINADKIAESMKSKPIDMLFYQNDIDELVKRKLLVSKKRRDDNRVYYVPNPVVNSLKTDIDIYNKVTPKILWILKEPNDKNEATWDQRAFHNKDISLYKKWRKTYKLIIKITYAILNNISEYKNIPDEYEIRHILKKIAFINIKKKGGTAIANDSSIRKIYYKDKKLILEQIEILKPDIIINCSRVWNLLLDFLIPITPKKIKNNIFHYGFKNNSLIINAYHPNNRKITDVLYFNNIMEYINLYKNEVRANCT